MTSAHAATRVSQEDIDGFDAAGRPDAVVVGLDPNLTYARLAVASDCIRAGAQFIATNRDPVYPTERGLRPGAGSIVIALESATGVEPVSIGKPAPYLLEAAAHAVGREPGDAMMIGDGIATDLAAARAVGARSILMLTGVTTQAQLDALPGSRAPDRGRRRRGRARSSARPARRGLTSLSVGRRPCRARGSRAAHSSNSARNGSRTTSSANATSSAWRSIAHSSGSVSPIVSTARTYSSDRVMSETVVSSVLSVTGTPARWRRASGCAATDGTIPACQFEDGTQVEGDAAGDQLRAQGRVVDRARAVGDPFRSQGQRPTDLRRAAPLAGVERDAQTAGARRLERPRVSQRVREARLRAGEVAAGQALHRGIGRPSRPAGRSPPGRATAAPCR